MKTIDTQEKIATAENSAAVREQVAVYCRAFSDTHGRLPGVYVLTLGCQQNEADSEKITGMAVSMGYTVSDTPEGAELIVVNTCAIREHAEQRALSLIGQYKRLKSENPALILAVCGCMTAQAHRAEELKRSYPYVDLVFGTTALAAFPALLAERLREHKRIFLPDGAATAPADMPTERKSPFKAWVSIMYGCNNFCSYCIVPYVRGRERSRTPESVLRETREAIAGGYREITLLGQNVNSYGSDSGGEFSFPALLRRLAREEGEFLLRFMTSHPKDVSDELIAVMSENEKIARHFHLPLQAGSDRILRLMNRRYTSAHYLGIARKLHAAMPEISITSDIIVGFPGETEAEFDETLSVVREARFDMIYPFLYSPRRGTPAAEMEGQVPEEVKGARFERLIALQNRLSREKNLECVGRSVRVLLDGISKKEGRQYTGRTSGAKLVHLAGGEARPGSFVTAEITGADTYALYGKITEKE